MNNKNIQSILQDALEEEIPSSQIKLWNSIQENLVTRNNIQQGEKMTTTKPRGVSRLAYTTLVIATLMAFAFITPQGRAFAQSILQLFTRAESKSFPVQVTTPDPSAPTAMPPSPIISVAEAEAIAGFDLAELPSVPKGFESLGARMYGNAVSIEYAVPGGGGNLILMQSKEGFLQSEWDQVPAESIVPVKVGDTDGEYAQGMFVVYADETSATWNSDAPIFRLRWFKDGIWFELTKYGNVEPIEYLDMNGLIALAESLK